MKPERSNATQCSRRRLAAPWACAWVVGLAAATAGAEDAHTRSGDSPQARAAGATLAIADPPPLRAGAAATIEVVVRAPDTAERPLLLTPSVEGEALHVVRGRLLRADARRDPDGALRFAIPVLGRSAGTAVLRVSLLAYRCAPQKGCEALRVSSSRTLQVVGP
jgi:hypothetical protein